MLAVAFALDQDLAGGNFQTKFGRNLLGGSDFDLKVAVGETYRSTSPAYLTPSPPVLPPFLQESEEDVCSSEDVSHELRRVLELGESDNSEDEEMEGGGVQQRLSTRPVHPAVPKPGLTKDDQAATLPSALFFILFLQW